MLNSKIDFKNYLFGRLNNAKSFISDFFLMFTGIMHVKKVHVYITTAQICSLLFAMCMVCTDCSSSHNYNELMNKTKKMDQKSKCENSHRGASRVLDSLLQPNIYFLYHGCASAAPVTEVQYKQEIFFTH